MKAVTTIALTSLLAGCSFFGKVAPLAPRYYDPTPEPTGGAARAEVGEKSLRLGHVLGSSHLRERIAYHTNPQELGFYEERRWTERPENYLRRELAAELFERRGIAQVVSGLSPTLEVELTDFSELKSPKHAARARARVLLVDARAVRFEQTFSVEVPIQGDDFSAVPAALGNALSQLVSQIGDRVAKELPSASPTQLPGNAP